MRNFRKLTDEKLTESFRMKFNVWTFFLPYYFFPTYKNKKKKYKENMAKKSSICSFRIRNVQLLDMKKMSRHENSTNTLRFAVFVDRMTTFCKISMHFNARKLRKFEFFPYSPLHRSIMIFSMPFDHFLLFLHAHLNVFYS